MQLPQMRTDLDLRARTSRLRTDVAQVILGPWPIRPVLIAFILFFIFQNTSGAFAVDQNQGLSGAMGGFPVNVARAVAAGVVFAILLRLYRRFTGRSELTRTAYLLIVLITGCTVAVTRYLAIPDPESPDFGQFLFILVRGILTMLILTNALGIADSRLLEQIRRTDSALAVVSSQRSAVLEAEERARRSIATILHDRVQAGLVAATLQLKQVAVSLHGDQAARLASVIADLENMRTQDVRSASRLLSPDLRNMTLTQALKVLAATYEPVMVTSVDVSVLERAGGPQEVRDRLLLGAYRISEQALLNSAAHGDATRVDVTARQEDDILVLVIADNGGGIGPDPVVPGTGTTIIDAWVATMGGTWAMDSSATGTRVTVRIPDEG